MTVLALVMCAAVVVILSAAAVQSRMELRECRGRIRELEQALSDGVWIERRCRVCDCTDDVACWAGCWWVEEDLCSSCADDEAAGSSLEGGRG